MSNEQYMCKPDEIDIFGINCDRIKNITYDEMEEIQKSNNHGSEFQDELEPHTI